MPKRAKVSAALAVLMLTGGAFTVNMRPKQDIDPIPEAKVSAETIQTVERQENLTPEVAIVEILSDENLKQVFSDLVETKKNMEKTIDEPIETIQEILDKEYGENLEIELILPQIFVESSGNHFNKDGSVNSSYANCNGWLQLSEGATEDMNKLYFDENEKTEINHLTICTLELLLIIT